MIIEDIYKFKNYIKENKIEKPMYLTSGGFDPLHIGHLRCIQETSLKASCRFSYPSHHGGIVVVIVNSDEFLIKKKGYAFMPLKERMEIVDSITGVDFVIPWTPIGDDMSVCEPIKIIKPDFFTKGGDRKNIDTIPEWEICNLVGCKIITNVGGEKIQHSSQMVKNAYQNIDKSPTDLYIFDFDRTLCKCTGKIYIKDKNSLGSFTLSPTEYAEWREEGHFEKYPGRFILDFRDFEGYPIGGTPIIDTFKKLKNALESNRSVVALVTGRGETKGPKEWLRDHDVDVGKMVFLATNGPDKRPSYDSLLNTYSAHRVHIFEDAECYIQQCAQICEKHGVSMLAELIKGC